MKSNIAILEYYKLVTTLMQNNLRKFEAQK